MDYDSGRISILQQPACLCHDDAMTALVRCISQASLFITTTLCMLLWLQYSERIVPEKEVFSCECISGWPP